MPSTNDVYQPDPNRIVISHATGDLQAWKAVPGDTSICMYSTASIQHKGATPSWVSFTQHMTASEARSLAAALTKAADHVEALTVVELEDA